MTTEEMQAALSHMGLDITPWKDGGLMLTMPKQPWVDLSPEGVDLLLMLVQQHRAPWAEPGEE